MILPTPVSVGFAALRAHWKALAGGVVLAAFVILLLLYKAEKRHSAKVEERLASEVKGRAQDRASYQNAQVAAAAMNKAQVATIEAEQEKISAQQKTAYDRDLARLRAGGVRQDLAAPQSASRSAHAGSVPAPTCRSDEANVCVDRKIIMQAAEIELGRNALIDWINRQIEVPR